MSRHHDIQAKYHLQQQKHLRKKSHESYSTGVEGDEDSFPKPENMDNITYRTENLSQPLKESLSMINILRAKSVLYVFLFGALNKISVTQFQYVQSPVTDVALKVLKEWQRSPKKDREEKIGENAFYPDVAKVERVVKRQGTQETRRIATKRSKTERKNCKTEKRS